MSDQPPVTQMPPADPAEQYRIGGPPQQTEEFEIYGQKWPSKAAFEGALAQQIREYEAIKAQAAASNAPANVPQSAPTQAQIQRLTQDQLYEKFAKEGVDAANRAWFAQEVFGDPNAPANVGATIREIAATAVTAQRQVQELMLKMDHPEVNWDDPKIRKEVEESVRKYGSVRGGIAVLQQEGKLPTRMQYEQHRSQQFQQIYGLTPQAQQAQQGRMPAPPPPSVPNGGGAPQPTYDLRQISNRMNEIAGMSIRERTPAQEKEFDRLAEIMTRESQVVR